MPVFLRWRAGTNFTPGAWTLGAKYRWVNAIAVVWVGLCVVIFSLPFTPAAVPWNDEFDWSALNYAPLTVGGLILAVWLWWVLDAKNKYTGQVQDIAFDEGMGITEVEPVDGASGPDGAAGAHDGLGLGQLRRAAHKRLPAFVLARAPVVVLLRLDRAVDRQQLGRVRQ